MTRRPLSFSAFATRNPLLWRRALALLFCPFAIILGSPSLSAHIGSPDVFLDAFAGPYRVYVTIRPPHVVPGVADVEVRTTSDDVRVVRIVPLPLSGPGAQFAPVPDVATPVRDAPRLFTGHLWMMTAGAWQVRIAIDGDRGSGQIAVPVPTLPQSTLPMPRTVHWLLLAFLLLLCGGFVSIVTAAVRDASIPAGEAAPPEARRRGRLAGAIAAIVVIIVVLLGNLWWDAEAASYARYVYRPLEATPSLGHGELTLTLRDPGWLRTRRTDDFIADHGHLMHLFIVSPTLDRLWHVHPDEREQATFVLRLPSMPAGRYETFGDVVHATGVPETVVSTFDAADTAGTPLTGDDSAWTAPASSDFTSSEFRLPDGGRVVWVRDPQPLVTTKLTVLTFRVATADGKPASDLELYMGMPAHAVIVRKDRRVFAHVHPSGSAPMAALQIAERSLAAAGTASKEAPVDPHARHEASLPPVVSFPYGFPEPGEYRVFVQIKKAGRIETAAFDVRVINAPS